MSNKISLIDNLKYGLDLELRAKETYDEVLNFISDENDKKIVRAIRDDEIQHAKIVNDMLNWLK